MVSEIETNLVSLLITLAAPLKRSSIILDYHINRFYNDYRGTNSNNTLIVSISGGYSDFLVPPYLSDIKEYNSLYAVVSKIVLLLKNI